MAEQGEPTERWDDMKRMLGLVLLHRDPVPLVVCAAVITIVLGASIALSNVIDLNPSYRLIQPICDKWSIGSLLIVLGVAKMIQYGVSRALSSVWRPSRRWSSPRSPTACYGKWPARWTIRRCSEEI